LVRESLNIVQVLIFTQWVKEMLPEERMLKF
jgi:hypothetical protein